MKNAINKINSISIIVELIIVSIITLITPSTIGGIILDIILITTGIYMNIILYSNKNDTYKYIALGILVYTLCIVLLYCNLAHNELYGISMTFYSLSATSYGLGLFIGAIIYNTYNKIRRNRQC